MKKIILLSLASVLLLNPVKVLAADIAVGDSIINSTVPSSFIAEESMVGAGATVRLPATIDLTYFEEYDSFAYKSTIVCNGSIADSHVIAVKCPETLKYTGENTSKEVEAFVKLGKSGMACFNNADLEAGNAKDLLVQIPASSVTTADNFTSTINFSISQSPVGMYNDIESDALESELGSVNIDDCNDYVIPSDYTKTSIDFGTITTNRSLDFLVSYNSTCGEVFHNDKVRYIQMSSHICAGYAACFLKEGETHWPNSKYNASSIKHPGTLYSYNLRTWIMGFDNLSTIVIPADVTRDMLSLTTYTEISSSNAYEAKYIVNDYYNYGLKDKGIPIGDAIVFVKGIDTSNNWVYVPNIVYRGTMAQWKALSANGEDWVFGNAANIVTVHCTDGKLFY